MILMRRRAVNTVRAYGEVRYDCNSEEKSPCEAMPSHQHQHQHQRQRQHGQDDGKVLFFFVNVKACGELCDKPSEELIGRLYNVLVWFVLSGFICVFLALLILFLVSFFTPVLLLPFHAEEEVMRKTSTIGSESWHTTRRSKVPSQTIRQ